ncbi:MAG: MarR family winged helix-turn-helix transcriptional regulator [Actinomycetota bacterium]|nr:MarR family winged helix-turn-helix transcriptional regulator [Actinomycetota bacterium]
MPTPVPLPTLLSQVLVAFTIEFDNEFEHQMPHRTTRGEAGDGRHGPWLASLVMWSNLMRFLGEEGAHVSVIEDAGGNLRGMERWGYVAVEPETDDAGRQPRRRDAIVRPTRGGRAAQEVWRALFDVIEGRWHERFGERQIGRLREALGGLGGHFDDQLPEYLPVLGFDLRARVPHLPVAPTPHLAALLSQVLLAFTLDFERESPIALAVSANLLRVLDEQGVRVRDLPRATGVSKEAIAMMAGALVRGGYAALEADPAASMGKVVRLTPKGAVAQEVYLRLASEIEQRWQQRYGDGTICEVREALEPLVGAPTGSRSLLFDGLEPYPDGWRASVRLPEVLPHHPMVLHRGGYPDGS